MSGLYDIFNDLVSTLHTYVQKPAIGPEIVVHNMNHKVTHLPEHQVRQRLHTFHDILDFCAYLRRHLNPKSAEILFDGVQVQALSTPEAEAPDVLTAIVPRHPRLDAWVRTVGKHLSQRELYTFVATHMEDFPRLTTREGKDAGSEGEHLAAQLRLLTVKRNSTTSAELHPSGYYKATHHEGDTEVSAKIPTEIVVDVPWWLGLEKLFRLRVQLQMDVDDRGRAIFLLAFSDFLEVEHDAQNHLCAVVRRELPEDEGWLVGRGELTTTAVPTRHRQ